MIYDFILYFPHFPETFQHLLPGRPGGDIITFQRLVYAADTFFEAAQGFRTPVLHMGAVSEGGLSQPATPHSGLHGSALCLCALQDSLPRRHGIPWRKSLRLENKRLVPRCCGIIPRDNRKSEEHRSILEVVRIAPLWGME